MLKLRQTTNAACFAYPLKGTIFQLNFYSSSLLQINRMLLIALALAPAIAIIFYVIAKDKYNKEPFRNLFISFLLGVASTVPAVLLQLLAKGSLEHFIASSSLTYYALFAFGAVAVSEEYSKFFMLRYYAYRQPAFDEPLDGIIYGVMVSMGFATLENITYVSQYGYGTAVVRAFLSVPAHACFGIITGYYVGLAKFDQQRALALMKKGLLLAIVFHGSFDFFLFVKQSGILEQYISASLLALGAFASFYIAVRLSLRSIHLHQELSRLEHERKNNLFW